MIGEICLDVWRWEATDLNTIGAEKYEALAEDHKNRGMVEVDVPHGEWEFKEYYRCDDESENEHLYGRLDLIPSLVGRYKDQCPSIREPKSNEKCCLDCSHYEGDAEVDQCNLHDLYHDWDMPESQNFTMVICNDFNEQN